MVLSGKQGLDPHTTTLSMLLFFKKFFPVFFTLPKLKDGLVGIQKKPGKNSLVQRSSLSETNGLSYSLGHCFKATNTDVQLRNKHESPTRHQPQSQQN